MNENCNSPEMDLARTPLSIFIVEDELLIRLAVADFLSDCGYRIIEAADADEAIAVLKVNVVRVDLVFSDVQMPGVVDGFGLARWIRQHRPGLPVILTSGSACTADLGDELCSIAPIVGKPYQSRLLAERIHITLNS